MARYRSWYMEMTEGMTIVHPRAVFKWTFSKPEDWTEERYSDFLQRLDAEIDRLNAALEEQEAAEQK